MFPFYLICKDTSRGTDLDMGKSSFPQGDLDPLRAHERISKTTNDIFFGNVSAKHVENYLFCNKVLCTGKKVTHYDTSNNIHIGMCVPENIHTPLPTEGFLLHPHPSGNSKSFSFPTPFPLGITVNPLRGRYIFP